MNEWLLVVIESFGYIGVAFLIAIENIFPPIPSEVILTFSGFLTTKTDLNPLGVVVSATIGAIIGALVLYYLGTMFSKDKIIVFIESKWGKRLGFKKDDFEKTLLWFEKSGKYGTFFGRFIPIIRSIVSIPAGISKMDYKQFILFTTGGTLIWNSCLVYLGYKLGDNWESVIAFFETYTTITVVVIVVVCILFCIIILKNKQNKKD